MKTPISKAIAVILTAGLSATLAACSSQSSQRTADSSYATAVQTTAAPETVSTPIGTSATPEATAETKPDTAYTEASTSAKTETAVTTTASTTVSTTVSTPATTAEPIWKETKLSADMYLNTSVYSRSKAYLGAPTSNLYMVNDKVKVVAVTDTDYYKLSDGNFIHCDYLSNEKAVIQTTTVATTAATVTAVTSTTQAAQTTPLPETTLPKSEASVSLNTSAPTEKYDSYTSSGYQPLDDIIFPILDKIITRNMTEDDKCLAVYDYLLQFDYVERTLLIPKSQKKYSEQLYAISLFEKKYGVCYDFSAAFKFMTRAVGVDTLMYYGQHSSYHSPSGYIPHTWDVIERGGIPYIYDIAMERITMDAGREDSYHCRYGITYEGFPGYYYIPDTFTR